MASKAQTSPALPAGTTSSLGVMVPVDSSSSGSGRRPTAGTRCRPRGVNCESWRWSQAVSAPEARGEPSKTAPWASANSRRLVRSRRQS